MERLLLLWDELDELVCWGRQLAIGAISLVKWPSRPLLAPRSLTDPLSNPLK